MKEPNKIVEQYLKQWKFWFKLSIGILVLFAVFHNYIDSIRNLKEGYTVEDGTAYYTWAKSKTVVDPANKISGDNISYGLYTLYFFSFFTIQSNIVVAISALYLAFRHPYEGKRIMTSHSIAQTIAIFITITGLIFNFMLLPTGWNAIVNDTHKDIEYPFPSTIKVASKWSAMNWFDQEILHTIGPIMYVLYVVVFFENKSYLSSKTFAKKRIWKIILYPVLYGLYQIIKNEILRAQGRFPSTIYPYFFFKIHDKNVLGMHGAIWFVIAILLIAGIAIGFGFLYNFISKKIIERKETNVKVETKDKNKAEVKL